MMLMLKKWHSSISPM